MNVHSVNLRSLGNCTTECSGLTRRAPPNKFIEKPSSRQKPPISRRIDIRSSPRQPPQPGNRSRRKLHAKDRPSATGTRVSYNRLEKNFESNEPAALGTRPPGRNGLRSCSGRQKTETERISDQTAKMLWWRR